MPELTEPLVWVCATNASFTCEIPSSDGTTQYTVTWEWLDPLPKNSIFGSSGFGWTCTCEGFKYRNTCSHIKKSEVQRCGWNAYLDPMFEAKEVTDAMKVVLRLMGESLYSYCCPECDGRVYGVRVDLLLKRRETTEG